MKDSRQQVLRDQKEGRGWEGYTQGTRDHLLGHARRILKTLSQPRPRKVRVRDALRNLDLLTDFGLDLSQFNPGPTALRRIAEHKLKQ